MPPQSRSAEQGYCQAFLNVQQILKDVSVNVPNIIHADLEQGFLCLSDFGDMVLSERLSSDNMQKYYAKAIVELDKMLTCSSVSVSTLPLYDEKFIFTERSNQNFLFVKYLMSKRTSFLGAKIHNTAEKMFEQKSHCTNLQNMKAHLQPLIRKQILQLHICKLRIACGGN